MRLVVERDPDVASLPRRMAAGTIDGMIWIGVPGAAGIGVAVIGDRWARTRGHDNRDWSAWLVQRAQTRRSLTSSTAVMGAWRALALGTRNWRSPGMRALGIRRIDARTAGPIRARGAVVRHLAEAAEQRLWHELNRPATERAELRRRAANDEIARMREARPDADPEELSRDAIAIQARLGVSCAPTPRLLLPLAFNWLAMLRSRRRQLLGERMARTVVVRER